MGTVGLVVLIGVCGVTGVRSWGWNALFSSINDFLDAYKNETVFARNVRTISIRITL